MAATALRHRGLAPVAVLLRSAAVRRPAGPSPLGCGLVGRWGDVRGIRLHRVRAAPLRRSERGRLLGRGAVAGSDLPVRRPPDDCGLGGHDAPTRALEPATVISGDRAGPDRGSAGELSPSTRAATPPRRRFPHGHRRRRGRRNPAGQEPADRPPQPLCPHRLRR